MMDSLVRKRCVMGPQPGREVQGGRVDGLVDEFAWRALEECSWVPAYEYYKRRKSWETVPLGGSLVLRATFLVGPARRTLIWCGRVLGLSLE